MSEAAVAITAECLELKLRNELSASHVKATDLSNCGCGSKFEIIVVSEKFVGLQLLAQHRLVNNAIAQERKHIHALTLKTMSPEAWSKSQAENR